MSDVKRLVYSIIQFLCDQLQSGSLSADATESLEVAIQCLEQAYGFSHDDATARANLSATTPLLELFRQSNASSTEFNATNEAITSEKRQQAEELKNKGNSLMKAELFDEAVECYTKAIQLDGTNAIYYCNRAAAHSKLNNHDKAIGDCDRAIQIDSNYSKAYGRKGLAHASLNQHREAKECYEKAVSLDPENESYQNNLKIAEEKLRETNLGGSQGGMFGTESGGSFNLSHLLSNPALMNMASQMMTDPNMQNLLGNILTNPGGAGVGGTGTGSGAGSSPAGVQALLQAGQQLAAQMQATNPELVEQLRRQMNPGDGNPPNPNPDSAPH